jgi:hypothetical protein
MVRGSAAGFRELAGEVAGVLAVLLVCLALMGMWATKTLSVQVRETYILRGGVVVTVTGSTRADPDVQEASLRELKEAFARLASADPAVIGENELRRVAEETFSKSGAPLEGAKIWITGRR